MTRHPLRWTIPPLAALWAMLPGVAQAQLDLGGVLGGVGDTVDSLGGTVGGVVSDTLGTVDQLTGGSGSGGDGGLGLDAFIVLDQDAALEAVQSNRAVPLEQILATAMLTIEGEVIDAHLIVVRGFLLYELKVVDADGDVSDIYFYARSGERVQTN